MVFVSLDLYIRTCLLFYLFEGESDLLGLLFCGLALLAVGTVLGLNLLFLFFQALLSDSVLWGHWCLLFLLTSLPLWVNRHIQLSEPTLLRNAPGPPDRIIRIRIKITSVDFPLRHKRWIFYVFCQSFHFLEFLGWVFLSIVDFVHFCREVLLFGLIGLAVWTHIVVKHVAVFPLLVLVLVDYLVLDLNPAKQGLLLLDFLGGHCARWLLFWSKFVVTWGNPFFWVIRIFLLKWVALLPSNHLFWSIFLLQNILDFRKILKLIRIEGERHTWRKIGTIIMIV